MIKTIRFLAAKSKNLYFQIKSDCDHQVHAYNIKILQNIKIVEKFSYLVLQIKK